MCLLGSSSGALTGIYIILLIIIIITYMSNLITVTVNMYLCYLVG